MPNGCKLSKMSPNGKIMPGFVYAFIPLQHMMVMEDMLKDFLLGEHLLLVGNQVSDQLSH